jgi:hypothetical protein
VFKSSLYRAATVRRTSRSEALRAARAERLPWQRLWALERTDAASMAAAAERMLATNARVWKYCTPLAAAAGLGLVKLCKALIAAAVDRRVLYS